MIEEKEWTPSKQDYLKLEKAVIDLMFKTHNLENVGAKLCLFDALLLVGLIAWAIWAVFK